MVVGEDVILSKSKGLDVNMGSSLRIDCKYILDDPKQNNAMGYRYDILPNADPAHNVIISVPNRAPIKFNNIESIKEGFEVEESEGYFTIKMTKTV